jgi:hypothetical protein
MIVAILVLSRTFPVRIYPDSGLWVHPLICIAFPIRLLAFSKPDVCNYPRISLPVKLIKEGAQVFSPLGAKNLIIDLARIL